MRTVAVVGGSNGGYAAAADLADQGFDVRWYVRSPERHASVLESETVELAVSEHHPNAEGTTGTARDRTAGERTEVQIGAVTTDLGAAVDGADLVLIPLPTTAQPAVIDDLLPHLADGQVVVFAPGNLGSVLLDRALDERRDGTGRAPDVTVAETPTLPYVTRRSGDAAVTINLDAVALPVGAYPAVDTSDAHEAVTDLYDVAYPATSALDCALTNSNPCVNATPTVLNAGAIECDEFDRFNIHRHGIGSGVYRALMAVDDERIRLRDELGFEPPHFRQDEYYRPDEATTGEHFYGAASRAALMSADTFSEDPPSLDDRYVHEDVGVATVLWASVGDYLGVETPTIDAVVGLAETMMDEPYRRTGRSLDRLGLSDLSRGEFERAFGGGES